MVLLAKALSGGHVPGRRGADAQDAIFDKIFNQMDRAVVHGSTFAKNDLAMAAGIATLEVIESREASIAQADRRGAELRWRFPALVARLRIRARRPRQGTDDRRRVRPAEIARLKASWNVLETANKGLFCQLITIPLFKDHKILTQVSGHASHTIKLLPPLTITDEDCDLDRDPLSTT